MSSRRRVLLQAILLAIVGAALPIMVAIYFSWSVGLMQEREKLQLFAETTSRHIDETLDEAVRALRSVAATDFSSCSPGHIARMRELMVVTPNIASIGYSKDGMYRCSAWGLVEAPITRGDADYVRSDGVEILFGLHSHVARNTPMMGLRLGQHIVLMDPKRLLGFGIESDISVTLMTADGRIVATRNDPPLAIAEEMKGYDGTGIGNEYVYAVLHQNPWALVALEHAPSLAEHLSDQREELIPIGIVAILLSGGAAIWFSRRRFSPLGELLAAVREREFIVHYQPIIELATQRCIGAEALVRWRRPDGSMVRPDEFIPLAESSGLILPITDQVIERVILDLNATLVADRSLHIAINLAAADIETGRFLPVLEAGLKYTGILPHQILLEATERGFIEVEAARHTLAEANRLGHGCAIDDFGTGYSSLQHLQTLPLLALKIDKSFVDTIGMDAATSAVTAHIIEMAQELQLLIVAEGVETPEQVAYLTARGVDYAQGWFYSKALPAEEFIAFYRERSARYGLGPEQVLHKKQPGAAA